jgi:hypothetical protein
MSDKHLMDADIQQFVLDKAGCSADIVAHMHRCVHCQSKGETYKLLFAEIKEQPKPVFDFDLSAAVVKKITTEKSTFSMNSFPAYLVIFSTLVSIGILAYLYKTKIIASGISSIVIFLVIITFLIFLVFQCIEMYKKYQRKIDDLNFY